MATHDTEYDVGARLRLRKSGGRYSAAVNVSKCEAVSLWRSLALRTIRWVYDTYRPISCMERAKREGIVLTPPR